MVCCLLELLSKLLVLLTREALELCVERPVPMKLGKRARGGHPQPRAKYRGAPGFNRARSIDEMLALLNQEVEAPIVHKNVIEDLP